MVNETKGTEELYTALSKGSNGKLWMREYADNLGMLAQVISNIKETIIIKFIRLNEVPKQKMLRKGRKYSP